MNQENTFKGKNIIKWALTIGIAIVLNIFFAVAIQTITPAPQFDDFCEPQQVRSSINTQEECVAIGGQWNEHAPKLENEPAGYCNEHFTCSQQYQDAQEEYTRNIFVALVVLGALSLLAGYLLRISPAVSAGLSYGGVLTFIIATIRYWGEAGDILRLAIVAFALIALITIGIKKFSE